MPPSINKNHLDLIVSLFSQSTRLSPAPQDSALNSMHHEQYPIWTIEL